MFQRLKGAFDSIADLAEEPPRVRPTRASSQSKLGTRTQSPRKALRPRTPDTSDKTPDPDPAIFVLDTPVAEESVKIPSDNGGSNGEAPTAGSKPLSQDGEEGSTSKSEEVTDSVAKAEEPVAEASEDVKAKLRKLERLESKYQELLKAYRKAHARNSAIIPFEASLRENTPLTSINDPQALIEYLGQLALKGDMVMDELKRVSSEKDTLKVKLEEAKQQTKAALDEVTQLKTEKEELLERNKKLALASSVSQEVPLTSPENESTLQSEEIDTEAELSKEETVAATEVTSGAPSSAPESESTTEGKTATSDHDHEVSRLTKEIDEKDQKIVLLEEKNLVLAERVVAEMSEIEAIKQELSGTEATLQNLEEYMASQNEADIRAGNKLRVAQFDVATLRKQLKDIEADPEGKEAEIHSLQTKVAEAEAAVEAQEKADTANKTEVSPSDSNATPLQAPVPVDQDEPSGSGKKKKNKKKKKKAPGAGNEGIATPPVTDATTPKVEISSPELQDPGTSSTEIRQRDETIEKLQGRLKVQDELQEEIDDLRDELITLGQEHVEAKDQVVSLKKENSELKNTIEDLEKQVAKTELKIDAAQKGADGDIQQLKVELSEWKTKSNSLQSEADLQSTRMQTLEAKIADHEAIKASVEATLAESRQKWNNESEEHRVKMKSLETDILAAQQLAASRYKDLTQAKENLQKIQPELTSLRTEVSELRSTRTELDSANAKLRRLETRENALQTDVASFKRRVAEADAEVEKLKRETLRQLALEESSRQLQTDLQRVSNEKAEIEAARNDLTDDLKKTQGELRESRARARQLEGQISDLQREVTELQQDISKQRVRFDAANKETSSARDQAAEIAVQMREAKERCENLEEELTDAHRLMNERAREGETMRHLLADVESRAETRVKELKERMEILTQERDRAENEASAVGRRRNRELEDLKVKLQDGERQCKIALDDKLDIERNHKQLLSKVEEDSQKVVRVTQELSETRSALEELRAALNESERHYRESDAEKADLKRNLDDSQARLEKAQKSQKAAADELRSMRATRIRPIGSDAPSTRSSIDSSRITSPTSSGRDSKFGSIGQPFGASAIDYVYLKNVLLQFLEQKDKGHQMQLIPVLSMLLHFDKKDEQRWTAAISTK